MREFYQKKIFPFEQLKEFLAYYNVILNFQGKYIYFYDEKKNHNRKTVNTMIEFKPCQMRPITTDY